MPRRIAPLTDTKVRTIKPTEKPQKLFDGGGLFLLVTPTGGKLWRLKYRFGGIEKLLAIGAYPQVSLADAERHSARAAYNYNYAEFMQDRKKMMQAWSDYLDGIKGEEDLLLQERRIHVSEEMQRFGEGLCCDGPHGSDLRGKVNVSRKFIMPQGDTRAFTYLNSFVNL